MKPVLLVLAFAATAAAQSTSGYIFVAPGGATGNARTQATLQAGGGVEVALPKHFGAGAELGALSPIGSWGESTLGVFSASGYYHFLKGKQHKIDPFVDAGYTLFFNSGSANLFHFGGGANFWATRHFGARVELRDQVASYDGIIHYWGFRLGVAFR
jgi:hypothetical protein